MGGGQHVVVGLAAAAYSTAKKCGRPSSLPHFLKRPNLFRNESYGRENGG